MDAPVANEKDPVARLHALVRKYGATEVGRRIGRNESTVRNWAIGRRFPDRKGQASLEEAFNIPTALWTDYEPTVVSPVSNARETHDVPSRAEVVQAESASEASAKEQIRQILGSVRRMLAAVEADSCSRYRDKAIVINAATSAIRVLGQLTGEIGATESTMVQSPHFKKFCSELTAILNDYPDAAKAVVAYIEALEQ